jgi:hypothetical protein
MRFFRSATGYNPQRRDSMHNEPVKEQVVGPAKIPEKGSIGLKLTVKHK